MFYLKDAPQAPSKINPEELSRVQQFKNSLGPEGTLHWPFSSVEDFVSLTRIHLSLQAQEFAKTHQHTPPSELKTTGAVVEMAAAADVTAVAGITDDEP